MNAAAEDELIEVLLAFAFTNEYFDKDEQEQK